jgi:hypothetical protein
VNPPNTRSIINILGFGRLAKSPKLICFGGVVAHMSFGRTKKAGTNVRVVKSLEIRYYYIMDDKSKFNFKEQKMNKQFSIKSAAIELGLSEVYIRRMIQKGQIETTKVAISDNVWKHMIDEAELAQWRKNTNSRSIREDGRNKFTVYANADEYAQLQKLLEANKLNLPIMRSNDPEKTKKRYLRSKAKRAQKTQKA